MSLTFEIKAKSQENLARVGRVTTPHGSFDTPAFMPVGTQATIKGLTSEMVEASGAQIILANTYHLMLRPGRELVANMGGLHKWMRWPQSILTDSGGYQVFSLSDINEVHEEGVRFRSHVDGRLIDLTPGQSIEVQNKLGADIIMAFDDCPPAQADWSSPNKGSKENLSDQEYRTRVLQACQRSVRWLDQCVTAHKRKADQALFGIIHGGPDLDLRKWCLERLCQHDLPGFAIGGVSVGEGFTEHQKVVQFTAPRLPADRPRYLMGVGYERDILFAVSAGVDMFDCVLPTRNGRNANAFTPTGQIRLRNRQYAQDGRPIDAACDCLACAKGYSRSYLRHLFAVGEMLGPILVSNHNLRHFQRFLLDIRRTIAENDVSSISQRWPIVEGH